MTAGGAELPVDSLVSAIRPVLSKHFKPALLARMSIVPFISLNPAAMRMIVELKLRRVQKTLQENNRMTMEYTPALADQITARCTEVETGARNIEYILNGTILPQLSQKILTHMTEGGMPSKVRLDVDEAGAFSMVFED
jgi:type VI secretion system protein VasG